jgi:hypothetical protein
MGLLGIRDAMHDDDDPYPKTRLRAAKQANDDMRRDEPWLWLFANVSTCAIHPCTNVQVWWLE